MTDVINIPRIVSLLIVAMIMAACVTDSNDEPESGWQLEVGDRVPQFQIAMSNGDVVSTSDLAGKTSLIVLFNTGCPDCRAELPVLQQVYDFILTNNLDIPFLCIAREENEPDIASYWNTQGYTMPYSPQPDRAVFNLFAGSGIPRIYIVGSDLRLSAVFGPEACPDFASLLQALDL